jgi:hypothetical protein
MIEQVPQLLGLPLHSGSEGEPMYKIFAAVLPEIRLAAGVSVAIGISNVLFLILIQRMKARIKHNKKQNPNIGVCSFPPLISR